MNRGLPYHLSEYLKGPQLAPDKELYGLTGDVAA